VSSPPSAAWWHFGPSTKMTTKTASFASVPSLTPPVPVILLCRFTMADIIHGEITTGRRFILAIAALADMTGDIFVVSFVSAFRVSHFLLWGAGIAPSPSTTLCLSFPPDVCPQNCRFAGSGFQLGVDVICETRALPDAVIPAQSGNLRRKPPEIRRRRTGILPQARGGNDLFSKGSNSNEATTEIEGSFAAPHAALPAQCGRVRT
jgi:hypothetical protein